MKDYSYSYEIYEPGVFIDFPGPRIDLEDNFHSRSAATTAMRIAMRNAPPGSSGVVYKRYEDGEVTGQRNFVKRESVVQLSS